MKWIFRSGVLLIIAFAAVTLFAYTLEDGVRVERYRLMPDLAEADIYPYLEDLELMDMWSPWIDPAGTTQVLYDNAPGEGQIARWKSEDFHPEFGEEHIFEVEENRFVRTEVELDGQEAIMTYALDVSEDGTVGMLLGVEYNIETGGLPLKRLRYARIRKGLAHDFDAALERLYTVALSGD